MSVRLLVASVAALHDPHRRAYDTLARRLGWEVHIAAPESLVLVPGKPAKALVPKPEGAQYELHAMRLRFSTQDRFHWYEGLGRLITDIRPSYVLVEYDPGSLVVFQAKLPRAGQKVIAWTVENIAHNRWKDAQRNAIRGRPKEVLRDVAVGSLGAFGDWAVDGLACMSKEGTRVFGARGWCKPMEMVPLGTDVRLFCPGDASGLRTSLDLVDEFVVGYFGRIVHRKGVHLLIDALTKVHPEVKLVLDVYENMGMSRYATEIMQRIDSLGLRHRVRTVHPEHQEMAGYMRCCDVIAVPSLTTDRWKEQFGRILPEAMACGVPVIGSMSGNIPDMVEDAGVVIPEGNADALAAAIEDLRQDPERRRALGRAGRDRVVEHLSTEAQADAIQRLSERIER
jgi:glycosyltransferase involved in cell wall biosynthesis